MGLNLLNKKMKFRIINKDPDQLEDILIAFEKSCSKNDLEQVFKNMDAYALEGFNGEDSINYHYHTDLNNGINNTYQTYLSFMGLCFYYAQKKLTNFAWYYYSRAEYFKGIHDSWNYVKKHEEATEYIKNEKQNPEKELSDLDLEISDFLQKKILIHKSKAPLTLIHRSSFIKDVTQDVFLIMKKYKNTKSRPITDGAIKKIIHRLIRDDDKLNKLIIQILK